VEAYLSDLGKYASWFELTNGQAFEPGLVTSIDLRAYRQHSLENERVRPATWNRRRIALALLCQWARGAGFLSYDPFQGVSAAEEEELPPRWLGQAEYSRVLRQVERNANAAKTSYGKAQALRDQAMVALMVYAGLREAELVALDGGDLVITPRGGKVIVRLGKGQKRREVPLGAEARRAVSAWLAVERAESGEPVFSGKSSGRLTTRQVQRVVAEIGRQAGVELTPHMLRHTFAKRTLKSGADLTVVQKLMGHSRLDTTSRYVKPGWDDLAGAVENL
jgi:integrase/recombinase XerC